MHQRVTSRETSAPLYTDDSYLLLDGLRLNVPVLTYTLDEHPRIEPLFRGTRHASVIQASPWLVKPSTAGRLLSERRAWQQYGLVLNSSATIQELADHLRSLISISMPTGQLAYCRFYDPGWAIRLYNSMSRAEFSTWSGPIQRWLVCSEGDWYRYDNLDQACNRSAGEEGWYRLRQEQLEQWQQQEYRSFLTRAAEYLGCTEGQPDYCQQYERIDQLTRQAQGYGLTMEHQILHYLELVWRFPDEMNSRYWVQHFANCEQDAELRLSLAEQRLFGLEGNA